MENNGQPLKIVHIISTLILGGAETFVVNLANEQVKEHSVSILTYKKFDLARSQENKIAEGVILRKINSKKKFSFKTCWQIFVAIKKEDADVVHIHLHSTLYYIFIISCFYKKPLYVHTVHHELKYWKNVFDILKKLKFINNSIHHVCISPRIKGQFDPLYPNLKLHQVSNGIASHLVNRNLKEIESEILPCEQKKNSFIFIFIANLSPAKNHAMIAEVFKRFEGASIEAQLILIGEDRDPTQSILRQINEMKAKNIFLLGSKQNAPDFLSIADAMVIPSLNEGMPIVALEALSMGKPIISTPAGGMTDIIQDGYNGYITKTFEQDEFYKTILKFMALTTDQRRKMGENAYQSFFEKFHIEIIAKKYEKIYRNNRIVL